MFAPYIDLDITLFNRFWLHSVINTHFLTFMVFKRPPVL